MKAFRFEDLLNFLLTHSLRLRHAVLPEPRQVEMFVSHL
jgi:hypothetical protein